MKTLMKTGIAWSPIALGAGLALTLAVAAQAADEPKDGMKKEEHTVIVTTDGGDMHGMEGHHGMMRMMMPGHPPLAEMDTNHDGVVSKDEFIAFHTAMYDKMAAEHGGKLTVPPAGEHGDRKMKVIVDGKELPPGEMPPGMDMHMMEMHDMHGMEGPGERTMIIRHGPGGHDGMGEGHGMGFAELDKNKDGKISFEEFASPMREVFDKLDKNHDGALSKDELPKGHMEIHRKVRMEEREEHHEDKK